MTAGRTRNWDRRCAAALRARHISHPLPPEPLIELLVELKFVQLVQVPLFVSQIALCALLRFQVVLLVQIRPEIDIVTPLLQGDIVGGRNVTFSRLCLGLSVQQGHAEWRSSAMVRLRDILILVEDVNVSRHPEERPFSKVERCWQCDLPRRNRIANPAGVVRSGVFEMPRQVKLRDGG